MTYQMALKGNVSFFAGDASLFFVAHEVNTSASDVNKDLKIISDWYFQRKMSFNSDPSKQVKGIVFSRKKK